MGQRGLGDGLTDDEGNLLFFGHAFMCLFDHDEELVELLLASLMMINANLE